MSGHVPRRFSLTRGREVPEIPYGNTDFSGIPVAGLPYPPIPPLPNRGGDL